MHFVKSIPAFILLVKNEIAIKKLKNIKKAINLLVIKAIYKY